MTRLRDRVDPGRLDVVVAVLVVIALELTVWLSSGVSTRDRIVTTIAAVASAAPIAVRRRWPAGALVFSMAVVLATKPLGGQLLTDDNAYVVPTLLLSYSAGAGSERGRSRLALLGALVLGWAWAVAPGSNGAPSGLGPIVWALFYVVMLLVPTWLIGCYARRYRERTSGFDALATRAAADKDSHEAAAIAAERARIGAELQDIIAHSISAMVIQAGSARLKLSADPDQARNSIRSVEETGRQALGDLRRLLGMLRKDDDPSALSPQPGLAQIGGLIDSLRSAGLQCERRTIGDPIDLTPGVDLVAYRVVEAAMRAAAAQRARQSSVTVNYGSRALELEVRGDRTIQDMEGTFAPLMQRVDLYRGELRLEATPVGFALRARLPLDSVGAA